MLAGVRSALVVPRRYVRTFASRSIPPGPRGSIRRARPPVPPSRANLPASSRHGEQRRSENEPSAPLPPQEPPSGVEAVSNALATTSDAQNPLVTPVHIPEDPHGIIKETHPAMRILEHSALVVQRQLEMMNVLVGFEQANRYVIMDPHGNHIGYLAELDHGLGRAVARQAFKTHRSFTCMVFDKQEREVLRFHRPFAWINSRIRVYDAVGDGLGGYTASNTLEGTSLSLDQTGASVSGRPLSDMRVIGAAEQEWAPLRRKYNLFLAREIASESAALDTPRLTSGDLPLSDSKAMTTTDEANREIGMVQFARVDEPFLSWDFNLMSEDHRLVGSVNRNFGGFAREIFTDTGVYALRMDAAGLQKEVQNHSSVEQAKSSVENHPGMTLDQRAVMLATAVSVDFDYFSRHSGSGGIWPMWIPWFGGGGEAAGGAAAGGAAAGAGEAAGAGTAIGAAGETGIASEVGAAARGVGSAEGWAAGAGTMAGYEAMQRARGQPGEADDASPQAMDEQQPGETGGEDIWGQSSNPWDNGDKDIWGGGGGNSGGGGSGGGTEGGGGGFDFDDWF